MIKLYLKISFPIFVWGMMGISTALAQEIKPTSAKELKEAVEIHQQMLADSPFLNYPARNVGPTNMSGRVVDIEVSNDYKTFYIAAASGGVWKTSDNGQSFAPIFDHQGALGIGDMALSKSNNNILWVGTGENNSSRSTYAGAGVYKSTDAGQTWQHMGLGFSQHIGQIQIHPTNPDIVWVGSMGSLYSTNEERGLYKTTDGGKTWKRTLFINTNTGVIDIKVDSSNPNHLLAATWERFRQSHDFIGNGKGSGIWRSEDGGETWQQSTAGFPTDEFVGRIGFDFSMSQPNIVYALHDNQRTETRESPRPVGTRNADELSFDSFQNMSAADVQNLDNAKLDRFLRSNRFATKYNAASVKRLLAQGKINTQQIAVYNGGGLDANAAILNSSVIGAEVYRSEDSGQSWKKVSESDLSRLYNTYGYYFGEVRASTSNPDELFVLGVPLLVSRDGGKTFALSDTVGNVHSDHQAMWINPQDSQHILLGTDGGLYRSYGGGERWEHLNTELTISQFYSIMVDENEPYNIYGGMQDNGVWYSKSTGKPSDVWSSLMGGDGMVVAVDTRTNDIVYTGFQFGNYFRINTKTGERKSVTPGHDIGRSPNRWNWRTPAVLSKHNQDIFYMGSQYVYRSLDRGDTWETISPDLTKNQKSGNVPFATLTVVEESPLEFGTLYAGSDDGNIWITRDHGKNWIDISKGLPAGRWISSVSPSAHQEGVVYLTLTGYRFDDFQAYVFKSRDYGKTWTSIKANLPMEATNVIKEDLKDAETLYLGTDHGLYISIDGGKAWDLFQGNLPNVAIYDMVIQPKANDLVIGTHGRSVYIVNLDILHSIKNEKSSFAILKADNVRINPRWTGMSGRRNEQAVLFFLPNASSVSLEIQNDKGESIQAWTVEGVKGVNVTSWQIETSIPKGKYRIRITNHTGELIEKTFDIN
ncbi:WD40/YVTN/BNR-like repeat-containing protein [Mongoliitalea daihaiensis]|uniref:WD40/YVTN/BNR-like repeat-containing protein n=1 Tax=Mongoliitalea daihaiensis TaxID=2782006 RepID=UPI001F25A439|nr:glycosyl hydrolase [Mongoliitalea daihaiensis]UJP65247.1 glycosyl hydrolase [Mongoliitalea daihaiensis]